MSRVAESAFGPDHWAMLLTLETAEVARQPIDERRMRCDPKRHGAHAYHAHRISGVPRATRLSDGSVLRDHDDWDCLEDLCAVGLLAMAPESVAGGAARYSLTERGWEVAGRARRHAAQYAVVDAFSMESPRPAVCPADPLSDVPVTRPRAKAVRILRDEPDHLDLSVDGVSFCYRRERGTWFGGRATTYAVGHEIDEQWLTAARAMTEQVVLTRSSKPAAADLVRCQECKRLLPARHGASVVCGAPHLLRYDDGTEQLV